MRYVELVEKQVTNRGNIVLESSIDVKTRRDHDAYCSVFVHTEDFYKYQQENNSVLGYVGSHGFKYLWIDIDEADNLPLAFESCKKIISKIHRDSGIDYESFVIYFSGSKGFHVGIPAYLIGQESFFSETTGSIIKLLANKLVEGVAKIDQKVYDTTRIFRLPNSLNSKKNMYKVLVSYSRVLSNTESDLEIILENAKNCINEKTAFVFNKRNQYLEKLFVACKEQSLRTIDIMSEVSEKDNNLRSNNTTFRIALEGDRNDTFYKQAYRLFAQKNLKTNEVNDIMRIIWHASNDLNAKNPTTETEFRNTINSAYKGARVKNQQKSSVTSIEEMLNAVVLDIKNSNYISTGNSLWDKSLGGGFKSGDSVNLIGLGGTMKSIYLQECWQNAARYQNKNMIYLNGEMKNTEFFNRFCKQIFKVDFSDKVKTGNISAADLDDLMFQIKELFGHRLGIISEVDLSVEDLDRIIDEREQLIGEKVAGLAIDSAGSLATQDGNEIHALIYNSKYVKELAKRKNIAIVTLSHASGKPSGDTRDVASFVRGGNKIIDNCDAYISVSKILDTERSTIATGKGAINEEDKIYKPGEIYLRFVNKRGSGETINQMLKLDEETLTLNFQDANDF